MAPYFVDHTIARISQLIEVRVQYKIQRRRPSCIHDSNQRLCFLTFNQQDITSNFVLNPQRLANHLLKANHRKKLKTDEAFRNEKHHAFGIFGGWRAASMFWIVIAFSLRTRFYFPFSLTFHLSFPEKFCSTHENGQFQCCSRIPSYKLHVSAIDYWLWEGVASDTWTIRIRNKTISVHS